MKKLLFITIALIAFCYANEARAGIIIRPVIHSGLVGYWDFQEGAGSTANDHSGYSNHGTLTNMDENDWVDGKLGKGLEFDGDDDYVDTTDNPLDITGSITISAWVYRETNASTHHITSKNDQIDSCPWQFAIVASSNVLRSFTGGAGGPETLDSTDTMSLNSWHHTVFVRTDSNITFYIDGVQDSGGWQAYTSANVRSSSVTAKIGSIGDGGGNYFDGKIDEVRIYNRALSAKEIERLYKLGRPKIVTPDNTGLVGYWRFDEGTGTKLGDHSGNGNHGTLYNMEEVDWVDGKLGEALDFDGVDEYVLVSSIDDAPGANTVSMFAKRDTLGSPGAVLYSFRPNYAGILVDEATGNIWLADSNMNGVKTWGSVWTDKTNIHHIVVVTYGIGASQNVELYFDGVSQGVGVGTTQSITTFKIGEFVSDFNRKFNGLIDETRIYNRALSASEIQTLYKSGLAIINSSQTKKLTDGLVGMWSFDGPDMYGNTAYDRSGQGNDGTLTNGPVRAIGKVGQALEFDGVDDFVGISDAAPNGNSQRTITAWFNADSFSSSPSDHIFAYDYSGGGGSTFGICAENNAVSVNFYSHGVITPKSALSTNTWYFVAVVVPPGATQTDEVQVYIDGSLQSLSDEEGSVQTLNTSSTNVAVGARAYLGVGYWYFDGLVDEARVYNRALSVDEVRRLYEMGR